MKQGKKQERPFRILSVSDFHCGNIAGLTPHEFNPDSPDGFKMWTYRRKMYDWFLEEVEKLKPIDLCVANGDLIDGKGAKTGGVEQITLARPKQIEMAVAILKAIDAKEYAFTFGTGYHTGPEDDLEMPIAKEFNAPIEDVYTRDVRGLLMRWRHHINGSQTPTGRATPLLRQQEWDILWSIDGEFDRADVQIFSHVHYFQAFCNRFGMVFTHPALQGLGGSQLGARRLGGIVDFGFLHFDVLSKDTWGWQKHLRSQTPSFRGA